MSYLVLSLDVTNKKLNYFINWTALEYGLEMHKVKPRTLSLSYGIELGSVWYVSISLKFLKKD